MSSFDHSDDFKQILSDAAIPTTEEAAKQAWNAEKDSAQINYSNASSVSPWQRFIDALITKPYLWLVNDVILKQILPNCFLKTAKGVFLEIIVWALGLTRKTAVKTKGFVKFSRTDTAGALDVIDGTLVQTAPINGKIYEYKTIGAFSFVDGQSELFIEVEALEAGTAYNLAEGVLAVLPTPINGVDSVANEAGWITVIGADTETDDELRLRGRNQFSIVTTFHTDAAYIALVTEFSGVGVNNLVFEHDAPRGPGTANIYILPDTGTASSQFLSSLQSHLMDDGNHGLGDDVEVLALPESLHSVTADVWPVNGTSTEETAQLLINVDQFIRAAFRENEAYEATKTNPFDLFSFSQLSRELHKEFLNLDNVHFNLAKIDSALDIPKLGSLTVQEGS
ncbi:MAG: baseplate J/gp47 family protein [Cellvibrionaceae bacterium]